MIEHNSEVYNHPYISFFIVHVYMEDLSRGVVYFTIIPLVSLLFAVLVSLHHATFFITLLCTVSGHSHTLDMAIHEHSIRDSTALAEMSRRL